jgi:hypothetical protein
MEGKERTYQLSSYLKGSGAYMDIQVFFIYMKELRDKQVHYLQLIEQM